MMLMCFTFFILITSTLSLLRSSFGPFHLSNCKIQTHLSLFGNQEPQKPVPQKNGGGGGGLFGGMGNMMESMKKAQEIAKQAEVINKEMTNTVIQGTDPTGQVVASYNGLGMPISMKVSDSILSQGADVVSLAVTQAMVETHAKAMMAMQTKIQALYSGTNP